MLFHVTLEHDEDGWVVATCPAFPGCASQGRDEAEALTNVREAIVAWLVAEDAKAVAHLTDRSSLVRLAMGPRPAVDSTDAQRRRKRGTP